LDVQKTALFGLEVGSESTRTAYFDNTCTQELIYCW